MVLGAPTTQVSTNHLQIDEEFHLPVSRADRLAILANLWLDGFYKTLFFEKIEINLECASLLSTCHSLALVVQRLRETPPVPLFFLCVNR